MAQIGDECKVNVAGAWENNHGTIVAIHKKDGDELLSFDVLMGSAAHKGIVLKDKAPDEIQVLSDADKEARAKVEGGAKERKAKRDRDDIQFENLPPAKRLQPSSSDTTKYRTWLQQKRFPDDTTMVEKRMSKIETISMDWYRMTTLEPDPDFVVAAALLDCNPFIDACIEGGFQNVLDKTYHPADWMRDTSEQANDHCIFIARADGSGGQVALWNEAWQKVQNDAKEPPPNQKLCVLVMGSEGEVQGVAPTFQDFLRCMATLPINEETSRCMDLGDAASYCGVVEDGKLWTFLDDAEYDDDAEEGKEQSLKQGQDELVSFLKSVWGVDPVTVEEVNGWQMEMEAREKAAKQYISHFSS